MKIKDIALSAAYVGQMVVKAICVGAQEVWSAVKYMLFADPVVEKICAENWGDGKGITEEQAANVTDIGTVFRDNTEITSFDEFEEFTGVTYLRDWAFSGSSIREISIPANVTVLRIAAFYNCSSLTRITIHDNLVTLGHNVFYGCTKLTQVFVDSVDSYVSIQTAEGGILSGVGENTEATVYVNKIPVTDVIISEGITSIIAAAFKNNYKITRVSIPSSATKIGTYAFYGCANIESEIILPNGVTRIEQYTFHKCAKVPSFVLPSTVQYIGIYSFEYINVDTFTIPENVTTIGLAAFINAKVGDLICLPTTPPQTSNYGVPSVVTNIYVPDQSVQAYREASVWLSYADKIKPISQYVES